MIKGETKLGLPVDRPKTPQRINWKIIIRIYKGVFKNYYKEFIRIFLKDKDQEYKSRFLQIKF